MLSRPETKTLGCVVGHSTTTPRFGRLFKNNYVRYSCSRLDLKPCISEIWLLFITGAVALLQSAGVVGTAISTKVAIAGAGSVITGAVASRFK